MQDKVTVPAMADLGAVSGQEVSKVVTVPTAVFLPDVASFI